MSTKSLFRTVSFLLAIAIMLMACGRPPAPLAPTATAAPTEAPAQPMPTVEPTLTPTPFELTCDWVGNWEYVKTYWPSINQGFSFSSIEMGSKPLCTTIVKVDVPGRGAFNFFYFRSASGEWHVSQPIDLIWEPNSLIYPIGAAGSDDLVTHFLFYDLRTKTMILIVMESDAVTNIKRNPMPLNDVLGYFDQQPCGLPVEVELVDQIITQIPEDSTVGWLEWTTLDGCNAYSTLFVTSSEDATRQYTWLSDGTTIWGPIARDGNMIPNILRWTDNGVTVTMFDFSGSVWTVQIADDGSFDVINETQYNQVLFGAALPAELERTSGPGYLEPLAKVFPTENPVEEISLEGWIPLPGDIQYLIAYYLVGEDRNEVVLFAQGEEVTNAVEFDADYIHFDWLVELDGDVTVVKSCIAGLTKETGKINTFTIVNGTASLTQKTGTCR